MSGVDKYIPARGSCEEATADGKSILEKLYDQYIKQSDNIKLMDNS